MKMLKKVFGTKNDREIKKLRARVRQVNALEESLKGLSDDQLQAKTPAFRERLERGETLDALLPEAFAVVREASVRVLGMRHYDVQLIGGCVLHAGRIAEMKTGEGKTLTATLPVYLNGLAGKGAHVVTVNDYLARRDAEWMGQVYRFLGMTTGSILHGLSDTERRAAYGADITYGTNNEFGFDYLRDNMKTDLGRYVQREHFFAIVDEVDSILIDEARTPLIISGPADASSEHYTTANSAVQGLQKDADYIYDEKSRSVSLTEDGISKVERRLKIDNLYDPKNIEILHHTQQALKAHVAFRRDVDYVVRDGKVIIVDEFTGRLMPGRRYSDGLHGALEAKESLRVERETQTLASITFQNFFRLYDKLSGMTGTADTEAVEFSKIYKLDVTVIPTNKPMIRNDEEDVVYRTEREKYTAIADEILEAQQRGQPVLVGTVSVEKSELLSQLLKRRNVDHEILNAKNHAREAQIIESAGQKGRVTISTNMAGRGTDIVLGEGVLEAGGLFVVGTERHESRRIDNQLRGRSGRQGDPGRSKFYLSLEDDLMRIFASDRLSGIMSRLGMQEGEAIISPMVSRAIEKAQKRVEEQNFSSRKHLLEYDDVMSQQRQVIYTRRRMILEGKAEIDFLDGVIESNIEELVRRNSPEARNSETWDFEALAADVRTELSIDVDLSQFDAAEAEAESLQEEIVKQGVQFYKEKVESVGAENMKRIEAFVYLQIIDTAWKEHLAAMDTLRDSVSLRGYGQRDPLQEYKKEAFRMFQALMVRIEDETGLALIRMPPPEVVDESELVLEDPDDSAMTMRHPTAPNGANAPQGGSAGDDSQLVYHGRRREPPASKAAPEPFVRDGSKVGRNELCPCGSGKKYKKCHGRPGAAPEAHL